MRGEPTYTWRAFLRQLKAKGKHPPEVLDTLKHRVFENAIEDHPFNPLTLVAWGYGHLLSEGTLLLLKAMAEKGLTAMDLAKAVGVSPTLVSWWLKDKRSPKARYFLPISRTLGIPLAELRRVFPDGGQEVVVRKDLLSDKDLPMEDRIYRRLFFLRAKLARLGQREDPTYEDAYWFANALALSTSVWALEGSRRVFALPLEGLSLDEGRRVVRLTRLYPHPEGVFTSRSLFQPYKDYIERYRGFLLEEEGMDGSLLFPGFDRERRHDHLEVLRDVFRPFRPSSVKVFLLRRAKELMGPSVFRFATYRSRHKKTPIAHRIGELWEAYLECRVLSAKAGLGLEEDELFVR